MTDFQIQFLIWESQFEPGVDQTKIQMFLFDLSKLIDKIKNLRELIGARKPVPVIASEKKSITATINDFAGRVLSKLSETERSFLLRKNAIRSNYLDPSFWMKQIQTAG